MRLLSAVDQLFLTLESRKQPMHVGGLFVFEIPINAEKDFVHQLVKDMQTADVPPTFPFNQLLYNHLFWTQDEEFDVEHHFRHIALPEPGRIRELLMYISKEHGRLIDRARPMWECHVIEGIAPETQGGAKRFALYFKIHHALLDGVAAMRLVQRSLSNSPNERVTLPLWSLMARHRNQLKSMLPPKHSLTTTIKDYASSILPVGKELKHSLLDRNDPYFVTSLEAPTSILNQRISGSRRIAAQSYRLARFSKVTKHLNVSINDVVLAVCSGAIRQYLLSLNELPDKPLIAFVPKSLRKDNGISGNQISFILANLGTHYANPVSRLHAIHNSMRTGKERFSRMNQTQVIAYSAVSYGWEGINLLTNAYPKKQAFNLIISNIPGSKTPLYWNGAKLTALYPASIVFDGQALNITLASYLDWIEFGITACSQALPEIQVLLTYIEDELTLFEQICDEQDLGIRE